jgi:hypothetical protein
VADFVTEAILHFINSQSITDRVLSGSDNYEIYEDNVAKLVKYVLED